MPADYLLPSTGDRDGRWLAAALEEYRSIRIEILDAIQAQRTIMQLGVTGLSVLIGLGLQDVDPLLAVAILGLVVPTVALFITAGAMGELYRAARGSRFLCGKEHAVNELLGLEQPALQWEQWLRRQRTFSMRDRAEFFAVFALSTASLALAFRSVFSSDLHLERPAVVLVLFFVISLGLWLASPILHFSMMGRARRQFLDV